MDAAVNAALNVLQAALGRGNVRPGLTARIAA